MSKVIFWLGLPWPRISTSLLLIIFSVSFIVLFAFETSNQCLCLLNTAHPGKSQDHASGDLATGDSRSSEPEEQVSGELQASGSGGQVFMLERKKEKKLAWLRKLVLKDKGHDGA